MVRRFVSELALCCACGRKFRAVAVDAVRVCDECWAKCCVLNGRSSCGRCFLIFGQSGFVQV